MDSLERSFSLLAIDRPKHEGFINQNSGSGYVELKTRHCLNVWLIICLNSWMKDMKYISSNYHLDPSDSLMRCITCLSFNYSIGRDHWFDATIKSVDVAFQFCLYPSKFYLLFHIGYSIFYSRLRIHFLYYKFG